MDPSSNDFNYMADDEPYYDEPYYDDSYMLT